MKQNSIDVEETLKNIKELSTDIFKDLGSKNKQKLVYDLLNKTRSKNQHEFYWMLLRHLNAFTSNKKRRVVSKLTKKLSQNVTLPKDTFIKYAYSIILGIMSGFENNQEVNENE